MINAFVLSFAVPVMAAATLSPTGTYSVKKELKGTGVAPKPLESFYDALDIDFESYDPNDGSGQPLMGSHTDQLMKLKKLPKLDPKDPAAPQDGYLDRTELTYERLVSTSKVRVPGLARPFETRSDVGALLSSKPLVIRADGKGGKKVDNLDQIRMDALAKAPDPGTRTTINTLLSESMLLRTSSTVGGDSTCLSKFAGKSIGAKWSFSREEQGVKLDYDCTFEGWSETGGKKLAVIRMHSPRTRTTRTQPNGMPGVAETESDGVVYFEPAGQETLLRMTTNISVEPAEEELNRLKARGQTIPRNKSVMTMVNHLYGI